MIADDNMQYTVYANVLSLVQPQKCNILGGVNFFTEGGGATALHRTFLDTNAELSYLHEISCDFGEIWYTTAYLELGDSQMTKYEHFLKFKMADACHFKNRFWP